MFSFVTSSIISGPTYYVCFITSMLELACNTCKHFACASLYISLKLSSSPLTNNSHHWADSHNHNMRINVHRPPVERKMVYRPKSSTHLLWEIIFSLSRVSALKSLNQLATSSFYYHSCNPIIHQCPEINWQLVYGVYTATPQLAS